MNNLIREEAKELLENKIAFIYEVTFDGMVIVVDGEHYEIKIDWERGQ